MSLLPTQPLLQELLAARLEPGPGGWLESTAQEISGGVSDERFAALLAMASRHAPRVPLAPGSEERTRAGALLPGWDPERWMCLDAVRAVLVLARPDLEQDAAQTAIEGVFRYADEGELRALYRCLPHLPGAERFAWRAGEGCRTNMLTVFEAMACDSPYPALYFDELSFNQAAVKGLFVGAPIWRMWGLDERLNPELARMVLDLAEERRSAGRTVQHELWLCLGAHAGERGLESLERELSGSFTLGRKAAAFGMVRAGHSAELEAFLEREVDAEVAAVMQAALAGESSQGVFRNLDPSLE